MADVKLLKYDGTEQQYRGVERVQLAKVDGGTAIFSEGEAVEGVEISPDFSSGDMTVNSPTGTLVKSAVIKQPDTLVPGNIRRGVNIAGIVGDLVGDTEERTVDLSMADGDQIILPSQDGKVISKATVRKPDTLVPENILAGVEIGGVVGNLAPPDPVETEITLDFSEGNMEVVADVGTLFSKVTIPVPENLVPENIPEGMNIAGILGTMKAGGSGDIDALIDGTITEIASNVTKICNYGFAHRTSLKKVSFPNATVAAMAFQYCTALESAYIPNLTGVNATFQGCTKLTKLDFSAMNSIFGNSFNGCSSLTALILRKSTRATLYDTSAFTGTPIASGAGYIYVPSSLLSSYKSASKWSTYSAKFRAIEDYPDICG